MLEIFPLEHIYLRFDLFYISNIVSNCRMPSILWLQCHRKWLGDIRDIGDTVSPLGILRLILQSTPLNRETGQSGQPIIGISLLERNGPNTYKPKLNFNG